MSAVVFIEIEDKSRISQCRRRAKVAAKEMGYSEVDRERVSIAVTEAVSNVVRHAGRGFFLMQPMKLSESGGDELAVVVWDEGPGIAHIGQCMKDGYSTAGGQGIGLGAMKRLSDVFELYLPQTGGLVVGMSFSGGGDLKSIQPPRDALWDIFATSLAKPGQSVSGDAWAIESWDRGLKVLLVDGLGHGPKAHQAATRAVDCFATVRDLEGESIMLALNEALKGTRGAVAAVAEVDNVAGSTRFTGMGNIFGRLINGTETSQLTSVSGTVGYNMRNPRSFEYPWFEDSMIILHSDGVGSRWDLGKFPGISYSRSSIIAGALLRGYRKVSDDSSIVCIKSNSKGVGGRSTVSRNAT
ncbi:ATP-binding protein [Pelagicoccus sp. SDUM812002]|uniref:ATP-binding protein n=1 Tax=Pelagicoccus sp. SDUM812002 TaxID=3041266 RepID=UPI0028103DC0|nr:ATP-binding protein [Pelagicoccus sp. SDUM812002]MDQ8187584.1 ATP-binding protein [Pelagicoccus sp. SDUM812002]